MIENEKLKQKSSLVKDDFRHLIGEEKKNSIFSEIDMNPDDEKPKMKSIFLGTDLKYLNELQIDASENPKLLEFFSCQSDAEVNFEFQDSKLETPAGDFPEQKSLVSGAADLRQLINGLNQNPSEDPKLDHSLKSDSKFERLIALDKENTDFRQLINELKQKPSEDPKKLDHSLKSDSEFEICSENREIKPNHEIFQAEFVSKSFDRFDEEIVENSIYR